MADQNAQKPLNSVPVWYRSSTEVIIGHFQAVARPHKLLGVIPSRFPFYDWIMGFHERRSDRAAMRGPLIEAPRVIVDVGSGTGYLLGLAVQRTRNSAERILAVDLSQQMLDDSRRFLCEAGLLVPQIAFSRSDCGTLPLADDSCDLYVSSYLLDMLPDDELTATLIEMQRVMRPGGQAILLTMTLELDGAPPVKRLFFRLANAFYNGGYSNGRWNRIWRLFCSGYAPHCRPIALGAHLRELSAMEVECTSLSRVTVFPVRVYYLRKVDG